MEEQQQRQQQQQQRGCVFRLYHPKGSPGVQRGEEVFNSYGRRDNRHFLLYYGFCLPDNEWEAVELPPLPPVPRAGGRPGSSVVQSAVLALGAERAGAVLQGTHALTASGFNWDLLCYARTLTLALDPREQQRQHTSTTVDLTRPLSRRHERATLRRLQALLEGALAAFPTTLAEDEAALRRLESQPQPQSQQQERQQQQQQQQQQEQQRRRQEHRRRVALTYRVLRKRIVHRHLRAVAALLGLVNDGDGDDALLRRGVEGWDKGVKEYVDCVKALGDD